MHVSSMPHTAAIVLDIIMETFKKICEECTVHYKFSRTSGCVGYLLRDNISQSSKFATIYPLNSKEDSDKYGTAFLNLSNTIIIAKALDEAFLNAIKDGIVPNKR